MSDVETTAGLAEASTTVPKAMPALVLSRGTSIGRYVVLGTLGAGGMGTVYRGYDPQLIREVALKRLRPDVSDDQAPSRLLREARAMARLNHPNVVALHDVVAEGDTITLAMELVRGGTLSSWLEAPRSRAEIVTAFIAAGRGLAAAHAIGLVHRDFKPDNVLVSDEWAVKVTDFGLVKPYRELGPGPGSGLGSAVDLAPDSAPSRPPTATITEHGLVLGTPRYMPPEQYQQGVVDARSDQYAFCVSLWRALCGEFPFAGEGAALLEAKLAGPPSLPKPLAASGRTAKALVRGLSVRPEDRFASMDALLDAVEPRRRGMIRWAVAVGVLALGAAGWWGAQANTQPCAEIEGAVDAAWSAEQRATLRAGLPADAAEFLRHSWERTAAGLDDYVQQWKDVRGQTCRAVHVQATLSPAQGDLRVGCLDAARIELDAAVGVLHDGGPEAIIHGPALVRDLPELARCADEAELARGVVAREVNAGSVVRAEMQQTAARLAALITAGRFDAAVTEGEAAWAEAEALGADPLRARIGRSYAAALSRRGRFDDAEPIFEHALALALKSDSDFDAARIALEYGFALSTRAERHVEAQRLAQTGRAIGERPFAPPPLRARALSTLSLIHRQRGQADEALALGRQALELRIEQLGERHPDVAVSRNNLALVLYDLDRNDEAAEQGRIALAIWRDALGPGHPEVGNAHNSLAMVLERAGKLDEAEREYRSALGIRRTTLGERHAATIATRHNLGLVLRRRGQLDAAQSMIRTAQQQWAEALPADHSYHAIGNLSLGLVLHDLGRLDEARAALERSAELGLEAYGPEHRQMCTIWNALAAVLLDQGKRAAAADHARRSATLAATALAEDHRVAVRARELLAQAQSSGELEASPVSPVP